MMWNYCDDLEWMRCDSLRAYREIYLERHYVSIDWNVYIAFEHWNSDTEDRCRTGCHDIALQNMQIVYDSMNRLNK